MAIGQRSASEIARDRRKIASMYLQGILQSDIARKVGLSQATISRDLKVLHEQWIEDANVSIKAAKAKELAKIDALECTYYDAWLRSQEDAESTTQKMTGASVLGKKEMSKTVKGQVGDARFLAGVQWCIDRRCKILGIDAPVKSQAEVTGKLVMIQLDQ